MALILALDQGTTSSRSILFDETGALVTAAQREFTQYFPQPGWVEHDPNEIWESQRATIEEVMREAGVRAAEVSAIGITNQRETTVVWDRRSGQPVYNAIVWQDRRTAGRVDRLREEGVTDSIKSKTGLVTDAYFSATKIEWILEDVEGARELAEEGHLAFGTIDAWLIWNLTGGAVHATDASNASRTMLFDVHAGAWDGDLSAIFNVPGAMLPDVVDSSGAIGEVTTIDAIRGVPIAGIAGDQQAALFGQLCLTPGMSKTTYGTGCFTLLNTGDHPAESDRLLTTVAWRRGGAMTCALEGSVFIGGAVVQWLRDGLGIIRSSSEIESLARSVDDSGGVILVPAFAGLGAPQWDQYARGTICGMTRGTTAAHIARAALEAIAFQVADLIDAMRAEGAMDVSEMRIDGGASKNNLLAQMQADLMQVPVVRPHITETTALGAAFLAGLAAGVWKDESELASTWREDQRFRPSISANEAQDRRALWNRAVDRAKGWVES